MKEQLVSFQVAKLAKEKDFNVETLHFYCKNRTCDYIKTPYKYSFEVNANQERLINGEIDNFGYGITWSAPTQSLLQRWLREVHNLFVQAEIEMIVNSITLFTVKVYSDDISINNEFGICKMLTITGFKTYEQALEVGLFEALKLIK